MVGDAVLVLSTTIVCQVKHGNPDDLLLWQSASRFQVCRDTNALTSGGVASQLLNQVMINRKVRAGPGWLPDQLASRVRVFNETSWVSAQKKMSTSIDSRWSNSRKIFDQLQCSLSDTWLRRNYKQIRRWNRPDISL